MHWYFEETEHYRRALAAYWRFSEEGTSTPSSYTSGEVRLDDGRDYVRIANSIGTLAVYRVKPDGILRRLKRWPKILDELQIKENHSAQELSHTC